MARPAVSMDIKPNPLIMATQFGAWGGSIGEFGEPLKAAIDQVVAPSIATNFEVGGRPSWTELQPQTIDRRLGSGPPLTATGLLKSVATSPSVWDIDDDQATITSSSLGEAHYGLFHQTGTRHMPERVWAILQPEDVDKIEELMGDWGGITAARAGVIGAFLGRFGRIFGRKR